MQLGNVVVPRGGSTIALRERLGLRKGRANNLTVRIHLVFCALAAARAYRSDGWLTVAEIGALDGWERNGSVAKLFANEFELGANAIIEQRGRGGEAQLRLRIPPAEISLGELPDVVQRLFGRDRSTPAPTEDLMPHPIEDRDLATAVAMALRTSIPGLVLQLRPAYQGGRSSLVLCGVVLRDPEAMPAIPSATAVLVKIPFAICAGKLVVQAAALDHERRLLAARAGWPGLPSRVEQVRVDLHSLGSMLRAQYSVAPPDDMLVMDAMILSLGSPRTLEAAPRVLSHIIDQTTIPMRRLSRRDLHNLLTAAKQLASLLRLLHRERRAHRHISVDSIVVRYELGIFESVLAPDLAASILTMSASDDPLFRDLFDLGRVLVHLITGAALSRERQNFQPPEFAGRRLIKRAVVGEGEIVARVLFAVSRYLLEASHGGAGDDGGPPTVQLLDRFLDEIEHIDMLHRTRARGVPERRVSLTAATAAQAAVPPREIWERSAADPMAAYLVAISHLVDTPTLRRWCERYVTHHGWHLGVVARRSATSSAGQAQPTADSCIAMLRDGFGRSAAAEMWRYLSTSGLHEPADQFVRILRAYATHWTREERFDISHDFRDLGNRDGRAASQGLGDELTAIEQHHAGRPNAELLEDWILALRLLSPRSSVPIEQRRAATLAAVRKATERAAGGGPVAQEYERLGSWLRVGALMSQLQSTHAAPPDEDILALERALQARSSPEIAFWHVLLARAWAAAAARGPSTEAASDEPAWDKAMRALLVAAGVASSRKLPFEMAATLLASAALTRLGLSTPELRAEFALRGTDEENVRVQAAECALLASDAYQWLDAEPHHWRALLEAASLLQGSGSAEHLIQAFQLVSLARNNRILYRALHRPPTRDDADPPAQFVVYPLGRDDDDRRTARERAHLDDLHRAWRSTPGPVHTSEDPGTTVARRDLATDAPGTAKLSLLRTLQIELDGAENTSMVDLLLDHVAAHYGRPPMARILDLSHGQPPEGHPVEFDVVLFRDSLCRISQRGLLLEAAHKLLRPGGLVVATDWIQTRVTDRTTWSRIVETGRFAGLEVEPGYQRLCRQLHFEDFVSWEPCMADDGARPEFVPWASLPGRDARAPAMQRWFQRRLDEVREHENERDGERRSPYERAFLLRLKRDLDTFVALSGSDGPLGWLLWAARKPCTP
jgi:SAM-dependent methyltransferase